LIFFSQINCLHRYIFEKLFGLLLDYTKLKQLKNCSITYFCFSYEVALHSYITLSLLNYFNDAFIDGNQLFTHWCYYVCTILVLVYWCISKRYKQFNKRSSSSSTLIFHISQNIICNFYYSSVKYHAWLFFFKSWNV